MASTTRSEIFAKAARKIRADFDELSTVPHSGLKGSEAEGIVRRFLTDHLPKRFGVGAGFVIDPNDVVSPQIDVVVYDAMNCPVYRASDDAAIFPSSNVAAVAEVKSRLDKDQLESAFQQVSSVKSLAKAGPKQHHDLVQVQTLGCVFAFTSSLTLDKLASHYHRSLTDHGIGHHPDIIVVLDRGVITLAGMAPGSPSWNISIIEEVTKLEGVHFAVAVRELGDDSLDAFLRFLLAHLIFFRGAVDHPGLWQDGPQAAQMKLTYLGSTTLEQDPQKREAKLKEYEDTVRRNFEGDA